MLICTLKVPQLNELKINVVYFFEYRELRYVFSHIFHCCLQPFVLPTACKLLPLASVTGSGTKILYNLTIQILYVFKWTIIKMCLLNYNNIFLCVSTSPSLWQYTALYLS